MSKKHSPQDKTQDFTTFHYDRNEFKLIQEDPNYWKEEVKIAKLRQQLGIPSSYTEMDLLLKIEKFQESNESLKEFYLQKKIEQNDYEQRLKDQQNQINEKLAEINQEKKNKIVLNNEIYKYTGEIEKQKLKAKTLKEDLLKYGQHKKECIRLEAIEEGRFLGEEQCNCGWKKYTKKKNNN